MFPLKYLKKASKMNRALGIDLDGLSSGPCDKTTEGSWDYLDHADMTGELSTEKTRGGKRREKSTIAKRVRGV
jgi:hypothetical protein